MRTKPLILVLSLTVVYSCIDEYPLDITAYESLLVVDGTITNAPGPYQVKLSRSTSVSSPIYVPVENAQLSILDNFGQEFLLQETDPGTYLTMDSSIQGIPGRSYKLSIKLSGGETYESNFSRLRNSVSIDSVYTIIESRPTHDPDQDLDGLQFYINTGQAEDDSVYFFWRLQETYEYHAAFTIDYIYDGTLHHFYNFDTLFYCYKTNEIPRIYTESNKNKSIARLTDYPLHFVGADSYRLSERYSMLIRQYLVDREAFAFWESVKEQISNDELLFNSQFYQVRGNVKNVNDPQEPVMGYFTVAGASSKRFFVSKPFYLDTKQPHCVPERDLLWVFFSRPDEWPIYITSHQGFPRIANVYCFDCRKFGGVLEKPDFWIDE